MADAAFHRRTLLKGGLAATVIGGVAAPSALARPTGTARALVEAPQIYGTTEWGARPPNGEIIVEDHAPTYIVVHHTVEPGNSEDFSKERAFEISRAIQNFHMDSNGWVDSGQQFTNSRGGYVTEGRHRSLEVLQGGTQHVQGANVANHNSEVIGIENEGNYVETEVPQALWDSLVQLVAYMASQYGIPVEQIMGHRDFNSTQCPGDVLYARLPELREEVAGILGTPAPTSRPQWPLLRVGDRGESVRTAQRLLRKQGMKIPADGYYGPRTAEAVDAFAAEHGVPRPTCTAAAHANEHGLLGADIWPLIVTGERSTAEWKASLQR
jgi:hypothetical protein